MYDVGPISYVCKYNNNTKIAIAYEFAFSKRKCIHSFTIAIQLF